MEITPLNKKDWTYSVSVYKDEVNNHPSSTNTEDIKNKNTDGKIKQSGSSSSSMTSLMYAEAYTVRRLQDFLWLEESLRKEFHGSLAVPMLSMAITYSGPLENMTTQKQFFNSQDFFRGPWDPTLISSPYNNNQIDHSKVLAHWLSDILNGVRGRGEFLLRLPIKDNTIMQSESMEAFLYKNINPSKQKQPSFLPAHPSASLLGQSHSNDYDGSDAKSKSSDVQEIVKELFVSSLQCFFPNNEKNSPQILSNHQLISLTAKQSHSN